MLKIKIYNLFIGLLTLYLINSQATAQVVGLVNDENNIGVAFANVIAINSNDSSIVKATLTAEDGKYLLSELPEGSFMIKIVMLGYQDYFSPFFEYKKRLSIVRY